MMHSLADCPLRTFCCITTTPQHPFHILHLDSSALDLFLNASDSFSLPTSSHTSDTTFSHTLDPTTPTDFATVASQRSRALKFLRGKTIAEFLALDSTNSETCTNSSSNGNDSSVQSYSIARQIIQDFSKYNSSTSGTDGFFHEETSINNRTRTTHVHVCIHTSVPYAVSPTIHDQIASKTVPQDQEALDRVITTNGSCHVYVLKDVTELLHLAQATGPDHRFQQKHVQYRRRHHAQQRGVLKSTSSSQSSLPSSSPSSSLPPSSSKPLAVSQSSILCSSISILQSSDTADWPETAPLCVTHSKLDSPSDWPVPDAFPHVQENHSDRHHCHIQKVPAKEEEEEEEEDKDTPGRLLLHATRFGNIDHAFATSDDQQDQKNLDTDLHFLNHDARSISAMANTSIMSYVHLDDIRKLCQGLDRICKSQGYVFRVRWRKHNAGLHRQGHEHDNRSSRGQDSSFTAQRRAPRRFEFQGEIFEEWIDPTASPPPPPSASTAQEKDSSAANDYAWTEVTGVLSNGQPMLAIRPLKRWEILEQQEFASESSMITASRRSCTEFGQRGTDASSLKTRADWKSKSKRMELDEAMKMPGQQNVSGLTTLTMTSTPDAIHLKMPGALPDNNNNKNVSIDVNTSEYTKRFLQPQSQRHLSLFSDPLFHSDREECAGMKVASIIEFSSTAIVSWTELTAVGLNAWHHWTRTVRAGQDHVRFWCEYILESAIDQTIELVSWGLTLVGVDCNSVDSELEEQRLSAAAATKRIRSSKSCEQKDCLVYGGHQHQYQRQQQGLGHASKDYQRKMSGLDRASKKILEGYPSLDGIVRNFGNSWLGKKIKSRLDYRLDIVADKMMDWWESNNDESSILSESPPSSSSSSSSASSSPPSSPSSSSSSALSGGAIVE